MVRKWKRRQQSLSVSYLSVKVCQLVTEFAELRAKAFRILFHVGGLHVLTRGARLELLHLFSRRTSHTHHQQHFGIVQHQNEIVSTRKLINRAGASLSAIVMQ